jgi:hypothetical protein
MTQQPIQRLARLASDLEEKRDFLARFNDVLEILERAGLVVAGERSLVQDRESKLADARELFKRLAETKTAAEANDILDQLDTLLSGTEWIFLQGEHDVFATRAAERSELARQYREGLKKWRADVDRLSLALMRARAVRAPVVKEEIDLRVFTDQIDQANSKLNDQDYSLLPSLDADRLQQTTTSVEQKIETTRPFAQQADLLLLRTLVPIHIQAGPPAEPAGHIDGVPPVTTDGEHWYHYTVLLSTPSELGAAGINIQSSSTLVEQDRELFVSLIDRVTSAIEHGLTRTARARAADPATPTPPEPAALVAEVLPSPTLAREGTEKERDMLRRYLFGREKLDPVLATPPTSKLLQHVGDLMFRLLIPEQMQSYLIDSAATKHGSLTITTNDHELPWELMYAKGQFLCLERAVARLPMGQAFPRRTQPRIREKVRFLLIYADPSSNLSAAKREVLEIKRRLKENWGDRIEVDDIMERKASGSALNEALSAGRYDVIHYAGHAYFNANDSDMSGLLLHQKEVFVAQKVRRLLEGRPLVFLNACETARTANEEDPQKVDYLLQPASGLASAFIYGGAIGCIGSLWPIYDKPAEEFAIEFYNRVLDGYMIGQAMLEARQTIYQRFPQSATWAAFVLYGNPTSIL